MKPRRKSVTLSDIAEEAGVSIATVSRALSGSENVKNETYNRIIKVIDSLGYMRNPGQKQQLPTSKGLIAINLDSVSNPFFDEIVKGAKRSVEQHGYSLFINELKIDSHNADRMISLINSNAIAGMIICNYTDDASSHKLSRAVPLIQCTSYGGNEDISYVAIDDFHASKNAVEHLISCGRKRIAIIGGASNITCIKNRYRGYEAALTAAGLKIRPEYQVELGEDNLDLTISASMQLLRQSEPPDAIFAASDYICTAIIRACSITGIKIPDDISLVGFDNLEISRFLIPSLTTVNQPRLQIGFSAAEMLFELMADPTIPPRHVLLDGELIIRESSVPPGI